MIRPLTLAAALLIGTAAAAQDTPLSWAMLPALDGLDADADGYLTPGEIGATRVPETFDLDGDGAFTVVELSQGYFAQYDANDDGYLDDAELEAMRGLAAAGVYREEY
ncbi:hypothetical protein [Jannaschia sp. LMIT008]|uniref:hypothetical protein n=1 Tax=Jannaschia maritima TaxID=3032585 RepID=UPI0028119128|nr:hypothetical protein [Jannaschia sp. LMIT008]